MSAGKIDILLNLWAATLAQHNDEPPFKDHRDLFSTIDSTPLGGTPWTSFSMTYDGEKPDGPVPSWMEETYDIWYRDPHALVCDMLANPEFDGGFDYTPYKEFKASKDRDIDPDSDRRFYNFMSGTWAWNQAVGLGMYINHLYTHASTEYHSEGSSDPWIRVCSNHPWK
jgi:hypothetical protein